MATEMLVQTRRHPIGPLNRSISGTLCCCLILAGCVSSSIPPAPADIGTMAAKSVPARKEAGLAEMEVLRAMSAARLSPDQAVDAQNLGKRVRWAGAVHHVAATDKGVCLTIIYALSGDSGEPRWMPDATNQTFNACTTGSYDPELVHDLTNVTIVGRVTGTTYIGMGGGGSTGPVVEIEKLFRWSDCLAGDTSPVCTYGFLSPRAGVHD